MKGLLAASEKAELLLDVILKESDSDLTFIFL